MNKKVKILLSCIITLLITVSILGHLTNLLERKASKAKYADFFSQKEDFNVLFFGTSHVVNGIFPMELWDDFGIVSYNLGGHSNQMATTYWTMENALDYTTPDLVVIDCLQVSTNWKTSDVFSFVHLSFDAFPLTTTKIKAIWDLIDDPYLEKAVENGTARVSDEPRTKIGLLWDYSVYHNRWTELEMNDFETEVNLEKGAEARVNVKRAELKKIDPSEKMKPGRVGETYLRKMIEDCQRRGIEVLLVFLPFPASSGQQKDANYIYDLAKEYNVNYINFLDMDIINYQTDLYDVSSHLNPSGSTKVTHYLGEYIMSHYSVPNQKDNEKYASWNTDYQKYTEYRDNILSSQTNLVYYLMLLSCEKANIIIDVRDKSLYKNAWIMDLINNIGVYDKPVTKNTDFIIKLEGSDKIIVLDDFRTDGCTINTSLGKINYTIDLSNGETGTYSLLLGEKALITGNADLSSGLTVLVKRDDAVIDNVQFTYTVNSKTNNVSVSSVTRE